MIPNRSIRCLGVLRELANSPNRETDDALILRAVLAQLSTHGISTRLATPEEFDSMELGAFDVVVPMCEAYPRLKRLQAASAAPRFVNHPDAVLNCYRTSMVELIGDIPGLNFPPTEIRGVEDGLGAPPSAFEAPTGWWAKRGDVHNTCDHDVVRIRGWAGMDKLLRDFADREITHYVLQPHIEGDLIKFYGVGPGKWFTWFYHDSTRARRLAFDLDDLAGAAAAGAKTLGLEVFGGDAIVSDNGRITIIDMNSWPSFAKVRAEAAVQIAWHIASVAHRAQAARRMDGA